MLYFKSGTKPNYCQARAPGTDLWIDDTSCQVLLQHDMIVLRAYVAAEHGKQQPSFKNVL